MSGSDTESCASDSSIYSQPSRQPCGFRSFKISAILSDPVLQQELQLQNPQLKAGLLAAGLDVDARAGVLVKYMASNRLGQHHHFIIDSYNISCRSAQGPLDANEDYVGMVLYSKNSATSWECNGVRVKSGYIYFKKTSDIQCFISAHGVVRARWFVGHWQRPAGPVTGIPSKCPSVACYSMRADQLRTSQLDGTKLYHVVLY